MKKYLTILVFLALTVTAAWCGESSVDFGIVFPINYYNSTNTEGDNFSGTGFDVHYSYMHSRKVGVQASAQLYGISRMYKSNIDVFEDGGFGTVLDAQVGVKLCPLNLGLFEICVTPDVCLMTWFPDKDESRDPYFNIGSGIDLAFHLNFTKKVRITGAYSFNYYFFSLNPQVNNKTACVMLEHVPRITLGFIF